MKDLLINLCNCNGVSGNENTIADYCEKLFSEFSSVKRDYNNNLIITLGNLNADKTILLDAHLDQIGFIISDINEDGFIKVEKCGGIDLRVLLGSPVIVHGIEDLQGIICCMPPHLSDGNEDKAPKIEDVWIDLGLPYKEVTSLVSLGDIVTLKSNPSILCNNRISSGALDNRASILALYRVCQLIKSNDINFKVVILLSCQEETYGTGAKTKGFEFAPDEAICVDVSFANQPGISDQYANISLGKGPMLCYSPILNKDMTKALYSIASKFNIPTQNEVCGGRTGTNADHISVSKSGVKTAVISIPQKNMHTQVEIVDLNDIENTAKLISEYIISGGAFND